MIWKREWKTQGGLLSIVRGKFLKCARVAGPTVDGTAHIRPSGVNYCYIPCVYSSLLPCIM